MKIKKTVAFALTLALGACMFAGCAKGPATDVGGEKPDEPTTEGVYTITFNANGGEFRSGTTVTRKTAEGKLSALPADPKRVGYTFDGWNLEADGTGTKVTLDTTYPEDTDVYAKWKEETPEPPTPTGAYKITFDANGGTWTVTAPEVTTVSGKITSIPTAEPQRTDYEFKGWNLKADGTGDPVTTSTPFTEPTTVYAKWESTIPANDPTVQAIGASGVWLVGEGIAGGNWDKGVQFTENGGVYVLYMTVSSSKWIKVRDGGSSDPDGNGKLVNTDDSVAYSDSDGYTGFNIFVNTPGRYKFTFNGTATTVEAI